MTTLNKTYWENLYETEDTGWNIGHISTPIKNYIDQLENKTIRILIPGAGNSYEAEYLWNNGFTNLYVLDIAKQPLRNLKKRVPDFPKDQLLLKDFFTLDDKFDLIIEQTFLCALHPDLRLHYVNKMSELIKSKGKLTGLLFNFALTNDGPPFGGSKEEYISHFSDDFHIKTLEKSYNSIKPRADKELFFIFEKK